MKKKELLQFVQAVGIAAIVFILFVLPVSASLPQAGLLATPVENGYAGFSYGTNVKEEPTAENPESKVWFNDGYWWGTLFDETQNQWAIHRLDWATMSWEVTPTTLDSRIDDKDGQVSTRFDALWDEDAGKLYLASNMRLSNPSHANTDEKRGKLFRYSYDANANTYTLDDGFPVTINTDRTQTLVIEKDSSGRLWTTYISRFPTSDPTDVEDYKVYLNYTRTPGDDTSWGAPVDLTTMVGSAAVVAFDDHTSLITYGDKVGLMWSNNLNTNFYYGEYTVGDEPTDWDINPVSVSGMTLMADDHIKLATNGSQVFAAIKTQNPPPGGPLTGVLARDTDGTFSFHTFSNGSSNDTHPTLVYHETENRLYMFVASNEAGGMICYNTMDVTTPLRNMTMEVKPCSSDLTVSAPHFIASSVYPRINHPTASKHAVDSRSGVLVLASDQDNGQMYLYNLIGSAPYVTAHTPGVGELVVSDEMVITATFSLDIDPATLNTTTFRVTSPGGVLIDGTVTYDAATRTATFTASEPPVKGWTYTAAVTSGITDTAGRSVVAMSWQFEYDTENVQVPPLVLYLPMLGK